MLFICHQMAMKHDADEKEKLILMQQEAARRRQIIDHLPVIWVLGGPGCGKGTQCAKIVEKYGFSHISTGDLLRAEVTSGSEKGVALSIVMKEGGLVSNQDVLILLEAAIRKQKATSKGFLIDGYPREKNQGAEFEKFIGPADLILYFECANETLVSRIQARAAQSAEKRADDNEQTLKTRIATFRKNTDEILAQYPKTTVQINAERGVEEIFAEVKAAIDNVLLSKETVAATA